MTPLITQGRVPMPCVEPRSRIFSVGEIFVILPHPLHGGLFESYSPLSRIYWMCDRSMDTRKAYYAVTYIHGHAVVTHTQPTRHTIKSDTIPTNNGTHTTKIPYSTTFVLRNSYAYVFIHAINKQDNTCMPVCILFIHAINKQGIYVYAYAFYTCN